MNLPDAPRVQFFDVIISRMSGSAMTLNGARHSTQTGVTLRSISIAVTDVAETWILKPWSGDFASAGDTPSQISYLWISQSDGTKPVRISLYPSESDEEFNVCSKNSASRMKSQNMSRSSRLSIVISICLPTVSHESPHISEHACSRVALACVPSVDDRDIVQMTNVG